MIYSVEQDPYCYPGTAVLVNLADLTDQAELDQFELAMYLSRAEEALPEGDLGYDHYRAIHHHLFQDVYSWAGQPRTVRIGKGGNWFCYPEYIEGMMAVTLSPQAIRALLRTRGPDDFAVQSAHLIAEINACHPFREGNGRTQLAYLNLLSATAGYAFNIAVLEPKRVISAMIESFGGNSGPLATLIADLVA